MNQKKLIAGASKVLIKKSGKKVGGMKEEKRVAIYLSVHKNSEGQMQILESQIQDCKEKILKNSTQELVGIYIDETGSEDKAGMRVGFIKMLNACLNGEIDIVITKSLPSFSRRLEDLLCFLHMLNQKGISVIFVKEDYCICNEDSFLELNTSLRKMLQEKEVFHEREES